MNNRDLVLLLTTRLDFSADHVVRELRRRGARYLRLDADLFSSTSVVTFDPLAAKWTIDHPDAGHIYLRASDIRSVYFRRPTVRRWFGDQSAEEHMFQNHWDTVVRSLMIAREACWVNHPAAVYEAEHKPIQLHLAHSVGLRCPKTSVSNAPPPADSFSMNDLAVVKGVDTVLIRNESKQHFGYAQIASISSLSPAEFRLSPAIFQQPIEPKTDIRVTIVGDKLFAAEIIHEGGGVKGDWRLRGRETTNRAVELPAALSS